jgi:serine/threonine protein kinase/Flp pilus assembly protein TadD
LTTFIDAFESARTNGPVELDQFLPSAGDPRRLSVLVELIRIDLEMGWTVGKPIPLSDYQARYPGAFEDRSTRQDLAFEEYRQRIQAGRFVHALEYSERFDISVSDWPQADDVLADAQELAEHPVTVNSPDPHGVTAAARAYQDLRGRAGQQNWDPGEDAADITRFFAELHRHSPDVALSVAEAVINLPSAGTEFTGFKLLSELGRGAFGRVFLAEQQDLAHRQVVLKVSIDVKVEARALAQLLHTNIVPIYSVHRNGLLQAVCMPYCGSVTLADVIRRFRGETVPNSGKGLVTILNSSMLGARKADPAAELSEVPAGRPASSRVVLELLQGFSYVEAVLWVGARIADALSHAHDRGILHRDLKPANVLLTDEGQPMLLDFNLSADTKLRGLAEAARLGGTLPYMSPEHLESFAGQRRVVDGRGDIYALGVMLYELLTTELPFPVYPRSTKDMVDRMMRDRKAVPRLRHRNAAVSPAVESIVLKCLAFDPAERYSSARALLEDLDRQSHHLPLRHAPNRSVGERVKKWARRHPRLSSSACLGTLAAVLLVATAGLAGYQHQRRMGLEARENWSGFRDESMQFQLSLTGLPEDDNKPLAESVEKGRKALGRYPSPSDPTWARSSQVKHLSEAEQKQLREEVGTLLLMLAHATRRSSADHTSFEEALRLNEQAEGCFSPAEVPAGVWSQRAELLDHLGRADEAKVLRERPTVPLTSARGEYLDAWEHARHGRYAPAVPLLEDATRKDPQALWAWFLLGRSYDGLGRDNDAIACYSTCLALQPDAHQVWFNRGLAQLRRGDFKNASADFDRTLQLRPDLADAYFNRGLVRKAVGDLPGAESDFTASLEHGADFTRVFFVRSAVRTERGDKDGAERDRQEGLKREPVEESCWTARGFARLGSDAKGALADFEKALERNPQYRPALVNKAHVFGELLDRPADAVATLDKAIQYHPETASLRSTRAVYLARMGRRDAAHRDAESALDLSGDAATRYQVAGVYSLTSKQNPDDRKEAMRLLAAALKKDYGFEYLDVDPELAPIRELDEYKSLVSAARTLRTTPPK